MSRDLRATYRLQLTPDFGFRAARELVPYLQALGVSHLYLSPVLQAREGSTHGYDVVDPRRVSDALGGEEELRALAAEGVQSLLLEGGPTLATAFLEAGLVDKLLLFVAPVLAGSGPHAMGDLAAPLELLHMRTEPSGEDLLLEAYLREP